MRFATQRPFTALALLVGLSTALVAATAITYRLSLLTALGTFYGVLALFEVVYLALVISDGPDRGTERSMADRIPPALH